MKGPVFAGIDVGSSTCEAVVVSHRRELLGFALRPTSVRPVESAEEALERALGMAGLPRDQDLSVVVATGYGRRRVNRATSTVTEITCHARGIAHLHPGTRLLIDVGGQDSKVVLLDEGGRPVNFVMNDRCAAGTGRFLEVMARTLEVDVASLEELHREANHAVDLTSTCTVFAETEVVSMLADGVPVAAIVRGVHAAIASRTAALVRRLVPDPSRFVVSMTGGVARNRGVVDSLQAALGVELYVPEHPDVVGALGAALIAADRWEAG